MDNEAAVAVLNPGYSKEGEIMHLIRSLFFIVASYQISLQMRGNFGEYKILIIPSYEFFSKQNILYNTPITTNEVRNIKNLQA